EVGIAGVPDHVRSGADGAIAENRPRTAAELLGIPENGIQAAEKHGAQIDRILDRVRGNLAICLHCELIRLSHRGASLCSRALVPWLWCSTVLPVSDRAH